MPDTGGEPEVLLDSTTNLRNPRLLPGGQAVIFTDRPTTSTYLLDLRTDSLVELIPGGIDAMYVETGHLIYADQAGTLWAVEFNVGRGEVVGDAVPVLDGISIVGGGVWARYSVSRSGTLVYETGGGVGGGTQRQLVVVDLEGNETPLVLTPREIGRVAWSPDGQSVVYSSDGQIYTYNVELGTTPRLITNGLNPVYSPDGSRVVFSSAREGTDRADLIVKDLNDDSPPRSIITLAGNQIPTQWPSDTLIVFESGTASLGDLWTVNLSDPENPRAEAYFESEADLGRMAVSPDLDGWRGHLAENGVEIESEVTWDRGGVSLYFRDPDGHSVELATPGVWEIY